MKPKETANKNRNSCNNFAQHGLDFLEFCTFAPFHIQQLQCWGLEGSKKYFLLLHILCDTEIMVESILNNQLQNKQSPGQKVGE
jgi:hypothetical protein